MVGGQPLNYALGPGMSWSAVSRLAFSLSVLALIGCATKTTVEGTVERRTDGLPDDAAVASSVLEHFAKLPDARNADEKIMFIVVPQSNPVSADWIEWLAAHPGRNCGDFSRYRDSMHSRAGGVLDLTPLIPQSSLWRLAKTRESDLELIDLWSRKIANRLQISAPAYDADGTSALIHISFLWSVHAASGEVVTTKRSSGVWQVTCADIGYAL